MDTPVTAALNVNWINRFTQLGEPFYSRLNPTPLPEVHWVHCNTDLGEKLGLSKDWTTRQGMLEALSGCAVLAGSQPLASVYSGHQFGQWAGQLGDGRALYLGEIKTPDDQCFEIQLKGAGVTPFSRSGDGRAVLRSSIREYLCSEAMHALGIATTRALCITGSSGVVYREQIERAAVVTRVSPSFIRFGHFEHFAAKNQIQELRTLSDFVTENYSSLLQDPQELQLLANQDLEAQINQNPYAQLLYRVTLKTARLIAQWQSVGFCHGVMNTDNMSILGLTLDYGPFQFMDTYVPDHICNHSDPGGRYAFNQQPNVAYWNLYCLGQALLPLINDKDLTVNCLDQFKSLYSHFREETFLKKLGLSSPSLTWSSSPAGPKKLIAKIEQVMELQNVDFTIFWRTFSQSLGELGSAQELILNPSRDKLVALEALLTVPAALQAWKEFWSEYVSVLKSSGQSVQGTSKSMLRANPKYTLRNHLGEEAIQSAERGDFSKIGILLKILSSPFDEHPEFQAYSDLPPDWASSISISCSS